jgi:hypothetical protein
MECPQTVLNKKNIPAQQLGSVQKSQEQDSRIPIMDHDNLQYIG